MADRSSKSSPFRRWLSPAIAVLATLLGGLLLYRTLSRYDLDALGAAVLSVSPLRIAAAAAFAAASYVCLAGFDWLALSYAGRPQIFRRAALASFTSLSLGHNIGFAALSSGAIRYRFYSRWGLDGADIARVIIFCGITVGLGLATLGGVAVLARPGSFGALTGLDETSAVVAGALCLAIPAAYLLLVTVGPRTVRIARWSLKMPQFKLAVAQVVLGTLNFACVAACLHQALIAVSSVSYFTASAAYVMANSVALLSHVPGGLGVIESMVLFLLGDHRLIGAVLVFRFVYFLLPLVFGLAALSLSEIWLGPRREAPEALKLKQG